MLSQKSEEHQHTSFETASIIQSYACVHFRHVHAKINFTLYNPQNGDLQGPVTEASMCSGHCLLACALVNPTGAPLGLDFHNRSTESIVVAGTIELVVSTMQRRRDIEFMQLVAGCIGQFIPGTHTYFSH